MRDGGAESGGRAARALAWAALPALYVLRNDLWFWDDPDRLLGLPVGLTYHILFSALVALAMWRLVRVAWPADTLRRLAGPDRAAGDADTGGGDRLDEGNRESVR